MKKVINVAIACLIVISAVAGLYFLYESISAEKEKGEFDDIRLQYTNINAGGEDKLAEDESEMQSDLLYTEADFDALLAINPDTVGWISIPKTVISYPVTQAENNNKYLNTSFDGEYSRAGCIFLDSQNSVVPLNQNSIIFGHNMGRGREDMFGTLLKYKDEKHWAAHKYIQFDTIHEKHGWWEIFSVIYTDIKKGDFEYIVEFGNEEQFDMWLNQTKGISLYDTGVEVSDKDKILTLSTCDGSQYGRSGRLLILAKHIGFP